MLASLRPSTTRNRPSSSRRVALITLFLPGLCQNIVYRFVKRVPISHTRQHGGDDLWRISIESPAFFDLKTCMDVISAQETEIQIQVFRCFSLFAQVVSSFRIESPQTSSHNAMMRIT